MKALATESRRHRGKALGESLILSTTTDPVVYDLRPGAKIPEQERRPNTAMIFMF